ncbi:MAG: alpha/beta hydrolase fold domain-containing protein [Planctomycetota bacterium]
MNPNLTKEQRIANWLRQQDPNKDGRIALDESTGLMKSNFQRNDTNKDGFLDKEELGALAERLGRNANPNQNRNRRQEVLPTDEQLRELAADNVELELNIRYREGHERHVLDLARPRAKSDKPRPALVFIHGGGWTSGDKRRGNFIAFTLEYAAKGYVTMSVNYRLSRAKLECVEDVKCAVRWLRANAKKYNVDPNRIGAYGNSAGAHLVTMLGVSHGEKKLDVGPWQEYSSAVQAVAASATPTSPRVRGEGYTEEHNKLVAPMTYVSADAPPFLLFHEESDRTVPVSNSDDFVKALKEAGAMDITYMRYTDGSGHGVFSANKEETFPALEKFFTRTLEKP